MAMLRLFPEFIKFTPARLVYGAPSGGERPKEQGPGGRTGAGGGQDDFETRSRRRAEAFLQRAGSVADEAEAAAKEGLRTARDTVVGTAKEIPGVFDDASDWTADRIMQVDTAARVTAYEAGKIPGAVKEYTTAKGREAWAAVRPAVEVAVGAGLMAKEKALGYARDQISGAVASFNQAVDWAKVQKDYVVNGVVNEAKLGAALAKAAVERGVNAVTAKAEFLRMTVASTIAEATATGKHWVKEGEKIYDLTTAKGKELAERAEAYGRAQYARAEGAVREAKTAVIAKGSEVWAAAQPAVETAVGLGIMAKEAGERFVREKAAVAVASFNQAVDWARVQKDYVVNGVVNEAKLGAALARAAVERGINAVTAKAEFLRMTVASTIAEATATGKHWVKEGEKIYDLTTAKGKELAERAEAYGRAQYARAEGAVREAKTVVVAKGKEAWVTVQPAVETVAGLGLMAKDAATRFAREKAAVAIATFNQKLDWARMQKDYVVNGVVNEAKFLADITGEAVAQGVDFVKTRAEILKMTVAGSIDEAVATGKHWVREGRKIYDTTTEQGRELLAQAQRRGAEAMGTAPARVKTDTAPTAVAKGGPEWKMKSYAPAPAPEAKPVMARTKTEAGAEAAEDILTLKVGINAPSTMWGIMEKFYGKGAGKYWEALAAANKMKIQLVDNKPYPQKVMKGQELQLPKILTADGGKKQLSRQALLTEAQMKELEAILEPPSDQG